MEAEPITGEATMLPEVTMLPEAIQQGPGLTMLYGLQEEAPEAADLTGPAVAEDPTEVAVAAVAEEAEVEVKQTFYNTNATQKASIFRR